MSLLAALQFQAPVLRLLLAQPPLLLAGAGLETAHLFSRGPDSEFHALGRSLGFSARLLQLGDPLAGGGDGGDVPVATVEQPLNAAALGLGCSEGGLGRVARLASVESSFKLCENAVRALPSRLRREQLLVQPLRAQAGALALLQLLAHATLVGLGRDTLPADQGPRRGLACPLPPARRERFVHLLLHGRQDALEAGVLGQGLQRLAEAFAAGNVAVAGEAGAKDGDDVALLAEKGRGDERLGHAVLASGQPGALEAPAQDAPQRAVHFAPLAFLRELAAVAGELEVRVAAAAEALAHPPDALRFLFEGEMPRAAARRRASRARERPRPTSTAAAARRGWRSPGSTCRARSGRAGHSGRVRGRWPRRRCPPNRSPGGA